MQTAESGIKEVYSRVLCEVRNNRYMLRVISFKNQEGIEVNKFGISEFFYQADIKRWLPSKKHHVFLPMHAWSALVGHSAMIEKFPANHQDVGHSVSSNEQHIAADKQPVGVDAHDEDGASKRQRGRPPKRVNDGAASTSSATTNCTATPRTSHKKKVKPTEKKSHEGSESSKRAATCDGNADDEYEDASGQPAINVGFGVDSKTTG